MKKRNVKMGLAALGLMLGMTGCNPFQPNEEEPVAVYGPPQGYEQEVETSEGTGEGDTEAPKGSEYDPAKDEPVDVYGPAPGPEEDTESNDVEIPYEPGAEQQELIYGPPESFGE